MFEDRRELTGFDWSLGDLETYFDEGSLLRVHRSFMINPARHEKGSRDYTLRFTLPHIADTLAALKDSKGIKLSRTREKRCKEAFGSWFT